MNKSKLLNKILIPLVISVQTFTFTFTSAPTNLTYANENINNITVAEGANIVDDAPPADPNMPIIPVTADNLQDMTAEAALLIEANTGRVLYAKNPDKAEYPASTTKIMTCLLALENSTGDEIVDVDDRAVDEDGSSVYLKHGDRIKMSELLQGTMLASGNDGADAIAYYIGKGSMEDFVSMMNKRAVELGATNTHFDNPHGLPDPKHYTTAHDLAKIAMHAYQNPTFRKIVSTKEQEIHWETPENQVYDFGSTNRLLWNYDDVTGIKTGYTEAAGGCLVASAERNGINLIAIVLRTVDSRTRFVEGRALLDYGFKQIKKQVTISANDTTFPVRVYDSNIFEVEVAPANDFSYPVLNNEDEADFTYKANLPKFIQAPLKKGDKVGTIDLFYKDQLIGSTDLVLNQDIDTGFNLWSFFHKIFANLFGA